MSFRKRAEGALRIAGDFKVEDFYAAPFPDNVPAMELQKISLGRLLNNDEAESKRVFDICTTTGFFYLDMLDHAVGRQMWQIACNIHQIGRDCFSKTTVEDKFKYKPLGSDGLRVFDRGYLTRTADQKGQPDTREIINVPQSEFFGTHTEGWTLPSWLAKDKHVYEVALALGNKISCTLLSGFEKQLQLPTGTFTRLHRLNDDSGDFVRMLRYPGAPYEDKNEAVGFPPHRDALSTAMLFTWHGGLQIPVAGAEIHGLTVKNEDWRWVPPEPGCAVVNLGEAMTIFTNKILKSGIHRVIKAPGEQRPHDRLSVLIATRPENDTPMKAFQSPVIPYLKQDGKIETSLEWGHKIIVGIQRNLQADAATRGSTSILANA